MAKRIALGGVNAILPHTLGKGDSTDQEQSYNKKCKFAHEFLLPFE
jgi:hypothetical protein